MIVLGINNMHDAAAAIVKDGMLIAAAEEERFSRRKHHVGFPTESIRYCLSCANIDISEVDMIGVSWRPWVLKTRVFNALKSALFSTKAFKSKAGRGLGQMSHEWHELFTMRRLIEKHFGKGKFQLRYVDHHLCHASSAYHVSPFDRATILTVDGAGEEYTTVMWHGKDSRIDKLAAIRLPHSLGQFYAAVTGFLGFKTQSDEYKVMGMAAYGTPRYADIFRKEVFRLNDDGTFRLDPYFIDYHLSRQGIFLERTINALGKNRLPEEEITQDHMDIASSAQVVLEEVLFHILNGTFSRTSTDNLCMAGGVALNCVANGRIYDRTSYRNIFIQPAAGDAGTSVGAAIYLHGQATGDSRKFTMKDSYLGPAFSNEECIRTLGEFRLSFEELTEDDLCNRVAGLLSDGKLIYWFQGRMEWGPRALGNRSLLADPRRADMKDTINIKVKQREPFRPFAPSVLEEKCTEYFDMPGPSPFMLFAFDVREDKRKVLPAVTHVDGTARPQTVSRDVNPVYWKLIKRFGEITGVPVLLNTSFNVQEPIVCTPSDAIKCFIKTRVDYLILNNLLVKYPDRG